MKAINPRTRAVAIGFACLVLASCVGRPGGRVLLINVAGSTFGYPIYSHWFGTYHDLHPNVELNYASIGSGGGIEQLRIGTVDLGASDMPLNDPMLSTFKVKILQFPTVLGAVVPTYNLPGIDTTLKFTPQALAGIYLGKISWWDDSDITHTNAGVNLPHKKIIVVHRSDGSGTTYVWTDYLSKVSVEWNNKVGHNTAVQWPVGLGGKGSEGVTGLIQETAYSIGYVELTYALQNHLLYGEVQNSSGKFIKATLASVTAAAASESAGLKKDIRTSITNAPGAAAYPISTFTYLLVPATIQNPAKRNAITGFLRWMLTSGQASVEPLSYARLPPQVAGIELAKISEIQ